VNKKDVNINEIGTVIVYVVNHISLRFAAIQQLLVNETDKKYDNLIKMQISINLVQITCFWNNLRQSALIIKRLENQIK
jgi:hypothetical protein